MPLPWYLRLKFPFLSLCYSKGVTTGKVPYKTVKFWCNAGLSMTADQPIQQLLLSLSVFRATPNARERRQSAWTLAILTELVIYITWVSWPLTAVCFLSGLILSLHNCVVGLMKADYSGVVQGSMCSLLSNQPGLWAIKKWDEIAWIIVWLIQPSCDYDMGPRLSCLQWLHQCSLSSQGAQPLSHLPKIFLYIL